MFAAAILNFSKPRQLGIEHPFQNENIGPELHISSEICPSSQNGYGALRLGPGLWGVGGFVSPCAV